MEAQEKDIAIFQTAADEAEEIVEKQLQHLEKKMEQLERSVGVESGREMAAISKEIRESLDWLIWKIQLLKKIYEANPQLQIFQALHNKE